MIIMNYLAIFNNPQKYNLGLNSPTKTPYLILFVYHIILPELTRLYIFKNKLKGIIIAHKNSIGKIIK